MFYHKYLSKLKFVVILLFIFNIFISSAYAGGDKVIIKLATLVPAGSPWHDLLQEMGEEWQKVSNGQVELRIYPGGTAGDEGAMVRKMRIGQLQAAMITNTGMSTISPAINAFNLPLAIDSYEKLDRVRQDLGDKMETHYEEKGFVILNWGDAGWVRFFVNDSDPSVESVRKAKMFVWAGDDRIVEVWKKAGFNTVPLAATDMLPALQTGMVNAYPTTALMSLSSQWFAFTPYMIDMPWVPLVGATIVSKRAWNKVPESIRPELKRIALETGAKLCSQIRALEEKAITEMQKRGLIVLKLNEAQRENWRKTLMSTWPQMKGDVVPDEWYEAAINSINGISENKVVESGYRENEK